MKMQLLYLCQSYRKKNYSLLCPTLSSSSYIFQGVFFKWEFWVLRGFISWEVEKKANIIFLWIILITQLLKKPYEFFSTLTCHRWATVNNCRSSSRIEDCIWKVWRDHRWKLIWLRKFLKIGNVLRRSRSECSSFVRRVASTILFY